MTASALQRQNMVESQIRPSDVTDRRITSAMQAIPREAFVDQGLAPLAYMDEGLPVAGAGGARLMLPPRIVALLLQLARVESGDRVLLIGSLTGYCAAIVARMAKSVVALENDASLSSKAAATLAAEDCTGVACITGELSAGHAAMAPYDVIILEGAFEVIPVDLTDQLAEGGRLVGIEIGGRGHGTAVLLTKSDGVVGKRQAFDAAAPCLPGFARPRGFVF